MELANGGWKRSRAGGAIGRVAALDVSEEERHKRKDDPEAREVHVPASRAQSAVSGGSKMRVG